MKTLTQNEILEELEKLGITSEEDLQISCKEYIIYLNNENLFSGEKI